LWLLFLIVSCMQAVAELLVLPTYFPAGPSLFPNWPRYFPNWALTLLGGTASLLLLPKFLSLVLVMIKGGAAGFGGYAAMTLSACGEVVISTFLAPVRMLFHSFFVAATLVGRSVNWGAQNRGGNGTTWGDALRFHWWGTALGLVWGWFMYLINPGFFLWLAPIVIGLALSVPLSVLTSRVSLGEGARRLGLFLTPADVDPPRELDCLAANLARPAPFCPFRLPRDAGFARAVVIPRVFALHVTLVRHKRRNPPRKIALLTQLVDKALACGPDSLTAKEKLLILGEPDCLRELHHKVWELDAVAAARWGIR